LSNTIEIKVRFSETDMLGHVNNASYFVYLEEARTEFLRDMLIANKKSFVVVSLKCDFIQQAYFDQRLIIHTSVIDIGNTSFTLVHEIQDKESGQLIAKGHSVVVHFNPEKQKSEPLTEDMRKWLLEQMK
jgi:acyl-CoA thioester hydrolase